MDNKRSESKKTYKQKVRLGWTKDPLFKEWILLKNMDKNEYKVDCKFCKCSLNAKTSALKDHALSKKHIAASEPFSNSRQKTIQFKKESIVVATKVAEARTALYIAQHSSIRPVDHLNSLFKCNFADSATALDTRIHRTKATAIIKNVWSPHMISLLIQDINNGKYSLIIDESQDITVVKYLGKLNYLLNYFLISNFKLQK